MNLKFWTWGKRKPKNETIKLMTAVFNKAMLPVPARYPKPAKSYLNIELPGGGAKILPVQEISAEEIILPNEDWIYTGVPPDLANHKLKRKWKTIRLHHNIYGMPFTHNPRNFDIFSDEKKKAILVARKWGTYVQVGDRRIIVMYDPKSEKPAPQWQSEEISAADKKSLFSGKEPTTFTDLDNWINANISKLEKMKILELPVRTEYDVTDIEIAKAETKELLKGDIIVKTVKSMEKLGEEKDPIWMFLMFVVGFLLLVGMFLYSANEGVFG